MKNQYIYNNNQSIMTQFELDDNKGRDLFKAFCAAQAWCKVHREAKKEYSPWDISYYSGTTKIIGEIKVRDYNHTAFPDWMLETKKYNSLKQLQKPDTLISYINIFKDDKIIIWDISNISPNTSTEEHQSNNYSQDTKAKSIIYLSTSAATIYNKLN